MVNGFRQVFLSAVSSEFRRCREQLCSDLSGPDMPWRVAEQAEFAVGGCTLLEKLDQYIRESSAVIHLIGDAVGACGKPLEVEAYLRANPGFLERYPHARSLIGDGLHLSYTQWEAYMALHHQIPLFVFCPTADYAERAVGFVPSVEDKTAQQSHFNTLRSLGIDRSEFGSNLRLSCMTLRSLSGFISRSGASLERDFATSLEDIANVRESNLESRTEEHSGVAVLPFHLEVALPTHFVAGQTYRIEFHAREPGRTPLEDIEVEMELGTSKVSARLDLLPKGENARLIPDTGLIPIESGTPQIKLSVSCLRLGSLRESFTWHSFANVHPAERAATISSTSKQRMVSKLVDLQLEEETLSPRLGACGIELRPVSSAGRRFDMGSPRSERGRESDEDAHPVRFSRSWWMSRHPISQDQYVKLMDINPSKFVQGANLPVESLTWAEAREFCERLTETERANETLPMGFHYRLPTEAEWEYSCRAGEQVVVGTVSGSSAKGEGVPASHPICTFPLDGNRGANPLGLCDMTGNVFQWCLDGYGPYPQTVEIDPCRAGDGVNKVIRGGSWHDPISFRRPAARAKCKPDTRSSRIGFRVVLARI